MRRLLLGPLAVLLSALALLLARDARAADLPYAGTWKITVFDATSEITLWVVKVDKDGKKIDLVSAVPGWDKTRFTDVKADATALRCKMEGRGNFSLIVYPAKDKTKVVRGSLRIQLDRFVRIRLDRTDDKKIDPKKALKSMAGGRNLQEAAQTKEVDRQIEALEDILKDYEGKPITYLTSQLLIGALVTKKASAKKIKPVLKVYLDQARPYGHEITVGSRLTLARMLLGYDKTQALALAEINQAAEALHKDDPRGLQIMVYLTQVQILQASKKTGEIKAVVAKLSKTAEAALDDNKDHVAKVGVARQVAQLMLSSKTPEVADLGLEYARKAVALTRDDKKVGQRLESYKLLQKALESRGKTDEAKKLTATIDQLEDEYDHEYAEENIPFKVKKFGRRKGKSKRVVLVELFTGATCPPCIAADIAFDAALKTYSTTDVVFLQYHLHIPRPDTLTNADSESRSQYYTVRGTPTACIDGKQTRGLGGFRDNARDSYDTLRAEIDKQLESAAAGTLKLETTRTGNKIDISANVSGLKEPGDKVRLCLVLVEDMVRYVGSNQQRLHHHVVRDFPGGVKGFKLDQKSAKFTASVDLEALRKKLNKYLSDFGTDNPMRPFSNPARPMAFKKLKVVAFIQDDDSKTIHQAAQVDVPEDKPE